MKGLIFSVKRYSIHDGPGIRVTFFMKGCPLNCLWCHNPEGISPLPETVVKADKVGEKEFISSEVAEKYYSVENILEILEKERVFINQSKGGVTFSGGEPMLQFEFLLEALKDCKENDYHTAVDTSGYSSPENFKSIIPFTDLFVIDIKIRGNNVIEKTFAGWLPVPFLSLLVEDCIANGKDYNCGGARYNTSYPV